MQAVLRGQQVRGQHEKFRCTFACLEAESPAGMCLRDCWLVEGLWGRASAFLLAFDGCKMVTQHCCAGAVPAVGRGEVQKRPENWVLPHESLAPELVVSTRWALNSFPTPDRPCPTASVVILSAVP